MSKQLSGVAGQYLVAAELTRRGHVATITLRQTQGIDVLASNADGSRQAAIQVKCDQRSGPGWVLNAKADHLKSPRLFYIFVRLYGGHQPPAYFIVPSRIVADYLTRAHRKWLETPGRGGRAHKDNPVRRFTNDRAAKYADRWDVLGLD